MRHLVVAGAGIGGLATALALVRAGHRVTVLERRPALAEFGAGIQLSPNATRILARLDCLDDLRAVATEPEAVRIRRGRDAAELARLPLGATALDRYGAPFLLLHRPDLQRVLADAAAGAGIPVRFGADAGEVRPHADAGGVTVSAVDHDWTADGFVDARGWRPPPGGVPHRVAWRALLPVEAAGADARRPETNLWLGPDAHLVHYPLRAGRLVNIVAVTQVRGRVPWPADDPWSRPGDPAHLRRAFAGWHPEALRLLDPAADWRQWPLFEARDPTAWSQGPTTRVGDAAHPMLPFLAQGASQAIEDAAALAAALGRPGSVTEAFAAYERQRRPRAQRVQDVSRRQGDIYHLGRPAADARDLVLRLMGGSGSLARLDWLYGGP